MSKPQRLVYLIIVIAVVLLYIFADSSFVRRLGDVSTIVLAILTGGYVLLTYWILKSTRQSIQEQTRPYIVTSLPLEGMELMLSVKNIGSRPAYNVKVTFNPSLDILGGDTWFKEAWQPLLSHSFLPPHFEVRNPVGITPHIVTLPPDQKVFHVTVAYSDSEGTTYPDSYTIDLNSYVFQKKVLRHDVEHYLKSISETLKKIGDQKEKSR